MIRYCRVKQQSGLKGPRNGQYNNKRVTTKTGSQSCRSLWPAAKKGTEFIRKETSVNRVVSKDLETSAAVNTYQQKQEEKTAFPLSFWLKKIKKMFKVLQT